jgi:hypothetical protein
LITESFFPYTCRKCFVAIFSPTTLPTLLLLLLLLQEVFGAVLESVRATADAKSFFLLSMLVGSPNTSCSSNNSSSSVGSVVGEKIATKHFRQVYGKNDSVIKCETIRLRRF